MAADRLLYVVFPYAALALAVLGGTYRYFAHRFTFSSLSSQILENRALFWGSVPWHYGIVAILLAHVVALLVPGAAAAFLGSPGRLYALEIAGMSLGLFALAGLVVLVARRLADAKARAVTSVLDWILLADLLLQVAAGVYVALAYRWGSLWYLRTAVPWLASLARFEPDVAAVSPLPPAVRFHLVNAFVLVALFPVTRLVHIFTIPLSYLWRPWQVVVRYGGPRRAAGGLRSSR